MLDTPNPVASDLPSKANPDASPSPAPPQTEMADKSGQLITPVYVAGGFIAFIAITWMGLDLVPSLGLNGMVGQPFGMTYTLVRLLANLILSYTALVVLVSFIRQMNSTEDESKSSIGEDDP
jgi:hypothetical protein